MTPTRIASLLALTLPVAVHADEGMWTFDQAPLAALAQQYNFKPDAAWLEHLRLAAVNLGGASASFVSKNGLVLTNHHVALGCVQDLSDAAHDFVKKGFSAATPSAERRCPGLEASVLVGIEDVTARIRAASTQGSETERAAARRAEIAAIEKGCKATAGQSCKVVTLYQGAAYHLYRSERYDDVRLVFAPEFQAAFFGGDPDNFVYPRYAYDMSLVRVWRDGKPVKPKSWLHWKDAGPAEGELLFVAGHPGRTQRLLTASQLGFLRDVSNPLRLAAYERRIKALKAFAASSPEAARRAADSIFGQENGYKSTRGAQDSLVTTDLLARKEQAEKALRSQSAGKVEGDPWAEVDAVLAKARPRAKADALQSFDRQGLLGIAGHLVQLAAERAKPNGERLPEYRDALLPRLVGSLTATAPYYKDLEQVLLLDRLDQATSELGADHPYSKTLAGHSADGKAFLAQAIAQTKLDDPAERRRLIDGGASAIAASTDPLIALARALDPLVRETRHFEEDEQVAPLARAAERIEAARYAVYGSSVAPDATGTLRFSYGTARGYDWYGFTVPWKTTVAGLFDRSASFDGKTPFDLAPKWKAAQKKLDPATPMDYVLTADIVGGNSGSPVVNRQGELVGLIFDGNPSSLANYYVYGDRTERALAVHPKLISEGLDKVYGAKAALRELRGR
jgi:hypothetical protein